MIPRGVFILIEGLDRCGKTTQVAKLAKSLSGPGRQCEQIGFPDRTTPTGQLINAHLTKQNKISDLFALNLLFASNRWERRVFIEDTLKSGCNIVCDRYSFSGIAYSIANGLSADWCWPAERGLPAPDVVIFLELSAADAEQRGGYGNELYERVDFQRRVADAFRHLRTPAWKVVDAGRDIDAVFADISAIAQDTVASHASSPINYFQ